jgi:hypothetical protein
MHGSQVTSISIIDTIKPILVLAFLVSSPKTASRQACRSGSSCITPLIWIPRSPTSSLVGAHKKDRALTST